MGLFRRGTKLLKFGSGLRDCCCRDEPEECWCPDPCIFYWSWDGAGFFPAEDYAPDVCLGDQDAFESHTLGKQDSYGMIDGLLQQYSTASGNPGPIEGGTTSGTFSLSLLLGRIPYLNSPKSIASVLHSGFASGPLAYDAEEEIFGSLSVWEGSQGVGGASYSWAAYVEVQCDYDQDGKPQLLLYAARFAQIDASQVIDYRFSRPNDTVPDAVFDTKTILKASQRIGSQSGDGVPVALESECSTSLNLQCDEPSLRMQRVIEDIGLSIGDDGVSVNGQLFAWDQEPEIDNRELTDLWKVDGEDPTAFAATLKKKESCRSGFLCDCNTSIIGRRVLFEGREFIVGDLDTILGTSIEHDGQSYWEEVSTGSFRRTDYETCGDGSSVRRVKQATVSCSDFDGVERWFVILDHTCYDRDPESCLPSFTATRDRSWAGYFSCTAAGKPLGMPKGENGIGDPDLYYDFTNGVLEHGCVDEQGCCGFGGSGIPFISFPNPGF